MARDWHGWSRQEVAGGPPVGRTLHIGRLPGRKSLALYSAGKTIQVHAYFRNEDEASRTMNLLDFIILGEPAEADYDGPEL